MEMNAINSSRKAAQAIDLALSRADRSSRKDENMRGFVPHNDLSPSQVLLRPTNIWTLRVPIEILLAIMDSIPPHKLTDESGEAGKNNLDPA